MQSNETYCVSLHYIEDVLSKLCRVTYLAVINFVIPVREHGWKEQENSALLRIKKLNEELDAAKQDLEKVREWGEELRQQRLKKV